MTDENRGKSRPTGASKDNNVGSVKLNREIQVQLGDQLRQMYNDVVSEGVPDKFVELLARLEKNGDGEKSPK